MSNPFLGELRQFAGNFAIQGWAFCNGQLLSIAQNNALFALLGTTFGGDGITTFGLPDLQGRVAVGQGQGPGLSNYVIGQMSGTETVTLNSSQMPSHTHAPAVSGSAGNATTPIGNVWAVAPTTLYGTVAAPPGKSLQVGVMAPGVGGDGGGSQPHNNLPPTLATTMIIAVQGVFPSRN